MVLMEQAQLCYWCRRWFAWLVQFVKKKEEERQIKRVYNLAEKALQWGISQIQIFLMCVSQTLTDRVLNGNWGWNSLLSDGLTFKWFKISRPPLIFWGWMKGLPPPQVVSGEKWQLVNLENALQTRVFYKYSWVSVTSTSCWTRPATPRSAGSTGFCRQDFWNGDKPTVLWDYAEQQGSLCYQLACIQLMCWERNLLRRNGDSWEMLENAHRGSNWSHLIISLDLYL